MDYDLQRIINAAFIYETCPQRRAHSDWRKEQLEIKLNAYIEKKLNEQSAGSGSNESEISNGLGTGAIGSLPMH